MNHNKKASSKSDQWFSSYSLFAILSYTQGKKLNEVLIPPFFIVQN